MGAIVNAGLPPGATGGEAVPVHRLPPGLRDALASALQPAFLAATLVALLVWVVALVGVKEVPLRESRDDVAAVDASAGAPAAAGAAQSAAER
jgi:hypothetical protein